MAEGMLDYSFNFDFFEDFIYGKHNCMRFPYSTTSAKWILDLIHKDVFVPICVPSLVKFVYYISFIDDFLRKTWVYFFHKNLEVFNKFKDFKALVENYVENKIKVLRTYNGGEF